MLNIQEFNLKEDKLIKKDNYYIYWCSQSDLKELRNLSADKDQMIHCPILNKKIPLDKSVVDHKHKLKSLSADKDQGQIRGILDFKSNGFEGKITNAYKRYGFDKEGISLPELLRNLADYLERTEENHSDIILEKNDLPVYLIHPNEVPKRRKVTKRDFNLIKKWWSVLKPRSKKEPKFTYENEEFLRLLEKAKELNQEFKTIKRYLKNKEK